MHTEIELLKDCHHNEASTQVRGRSPWRIKLDGWGREDKVSQASFWLSCA